MPNDIEQMLTDARRTPDAATRRRIEATIAAATQQPDAPTNPNGRPAPRRKTTSRPISEWVVGLAAAVVAAALFGGLLMGLPFGAGNSDSMTETPTITPTTEPPPTEQPITNPLPADVLYETWILTEIDGQPPAGDSDLTLEFRSEDILYGHDGCNDFFADYERAGSVVTLAGDLDLTARAACDTPSEQASRYHAFLQSGFSIATPDEFTMVLSGPDGDLTFTLRRFDNPALTPVPTPQPGDIQVGGTAWLLTELNGTPPLDDHAVTLLFSPSADSFALFGTEWCGPRTGGVRNESDTFNIFLSGPPEDCFTPEDVLEQGYDVLSVFSATTAAERPDDETLTLSGIPGYLTFTRLEPPNPADLAGTWLLERRNFTRMEEANITLSFDGDTLSADGGCSSQYALEGNILTETASRCAEAVLLPPGEHAHAYMPDADTLVIVIGARDELFFRRVEP